MFNLLFVESGLSIEGKVMSSPMYKNTYMRTVRHLNLTVDIETYQRAKKIIPQGQVSQLFNDFLKEYVKKKSKEELIAAYKRTAASKIRKEEDKIWEGTIEDGIEDE